VAKQAITSLTPVPEPSSAKQVVSDWLELILVLGAAAIGLIFAAPIRAIVDRGAINVVLFALVLSAAMTLPLAAVARLRSRALRLTIVEALALLGLPVIAWLAAQLVPEGPVRLGIICIGVAPAEIATVALATVAAGSTAIAACLLVVSTAVTALLAAPILTLLAGGGSVRSGELLVTLILVVIVPFAIGIAARTRLSADIEDPAAKVATGAVTVLVALVASQVEFDSGLARATVALIVIIAASALLGTGAGRLLPPGDRSAVLLSMSMRDFAVAAGIAAAAFGPEAAAPLGLYGIIVMIWGTVVASRARRSVEAVPAMDP
jgi:predicted Na+-dependent transporter